MQDPDTAREVRAAIQEWLKACQNRDFKKLESLYDPEALYAHDRAELRTGVSDIVSWFEDALSQMAFQSLFQEEALITGGDMAFAVGKFCLIPENKEFPPEAGRVALTYRRSSDNRWLLVCDIDNRPPDCSPADFQL